MSVLKTKNKNHHEYEKMILKPNKKNTKLQNLQPWNLYYCMPALKPRKQKTKSYKKNKIELDSYTSDASLKKKKKRNSECVSILTREKE